MTTCHQAQHITSRATSGKDFSRMAVSHAANQATLLLMQVEDHQKKQHWTSQETSDLILDQEEISEDT